MSARYFITKPIPNRHDYYDVRDGRSCILLNFAVASFHKRTPFARAFALLTCAALNWLTR